MFHQKVKNVSSETFSNKTLSIKFYLKRIKSKDNDFVVNTQIIYNRTKSEFTTGLRCVNNDWNNTKEEFFKNQDIVLDYREGVSLIALQGPRSSEALSKIFKTDLTKIDSNTSSSTLSLIFKF